MKRLQLTDGEISDILYVLDEKREVLYNEKNKLLDMEEGEITAHDRNVSKAIDEGYVLFTQTVTPTSSSKLRVGLLTA